MPKRKNRDSIDHKVEKIKKNGFIITGPSKLKVSSHRYGNMNCSIYARWYDQLKSEQSIKRDMMKLITSYGIPLSKMYNNQFSLKCTKLSDGKYLVFCDFYSYEGSLTDIKDLVPEEKRYIFPKYYKLKIDKLHKNQEEPQKKECQ